MDFQTMLVVLFQIGMPLATVVGGYMLFSRSQLGRALIERLRSPNDTSVVDELTAEVEHLRQRVFELEERQDFTERIVSRETPPGLRAPRAEERTVTDEQVSTPV